MLRVGARARVLAGALRRWPAPRGMASVAPRNHGYTRRAAAESRRMSNDYLRPWRTGEGRTPQRHKEHLEQLKIVERFARNKSRNATAVYNKYRKLFLDCAQQPKRASGLVHRVFSSFLRHSRPQVADFNVMMAVYQYRGHTERAKKLLKVMKRARVKPSPNTYRRAICCAAVAGDLQMAERIFFDNLSGAPWGTPPQQGDDDGADALPELNQRELNSQNIWFNNVIAYFGVGSPADAPLVDEAQRLADTRVGGDKAITAADADADADATSTSDSGTTTSSADNSAVSSSQTGAADHAFPHKGPHSLPGGHKELGDFRIRNAQGAMRFLELMNERDDTPPRAFTYAAVILACARAGDHETALRLFGEMKEQFQPAQEAENNVEENAMPNHDDDAQEQDEPTVEPKAAAVDVAADADVDVDVNAAAAAAAAHANGGTTTQVQSSPRRTTTVSPPSAREVVDTYTLLIEAFQCMGEKEAAMGLFKQLHEQGMLRDQRTFAMWIKYAMEQGDPALALEFFISMTETDVKPTLHTLTTLGELFAQTGNDNTPIKMMELFKSDPSLQRKMLHTFANSMAEHGATEAGVRLIKRAAQELNINPNLPTMTILLKLFVRGGEPGKALSVLKRMEKEGMKVDTLCYHTVLRGLADAGQLVAAKQMFFELVRRQDAWKSALSIASGALARGEDDSAVADVHRIHAGGKASVVEIDRRLVGLTLRVCLNHRDVEGALLLLRTMQRLDLDPDAWVYNQVLALLSTTEEPQNLSRFLDVLSQMRASHNQPNVGTLMHAVTCFSRCGKLVQGPDQGKGETARVQRKAMLDVFSALVGRETVVASEQAESGLQDDRDPSIGILLDRADPDEWALRYLCEAYLDHCDQVDGEAAEALLDLLAWLNGEGAPVNASVVHLAATRLQTKQCLGDEAIRLRLGQLLQEVHAREEEGFAVYPETAELAGVELAAPGMAAPAAQEEPEPGLSTF